MSVFLEGDRVCTVGRLGAAQAQVRNMTFPIWTGKVYVARKRQRDGVLTWRLDYTFGGSRSGRAPSARFVRQLMNDAEFPWHSAASHGVTVATGQQTEPQPASG